MAELILTGDVNLMNVTDPNVPFAKVKEVFAKATAVFSNLECCLFDTGQPQAVELEGFYADPKVGAAALALSGIRAVGIANNVNYGERAIQSSLAELDRLGIPHTGAGVNAAAAAKPALFENGGLRFGFLQRSSVYWPTGHEAGKQSTGIAVLRGHTAYHVPVHKLKPGTYPINRPGVPPEVLTWADKTYLEAFKSQIAALRPQVDILVASCHWGLGTEVLDYMTEIARAAIDSGADAVIGHGPHYSLPIEVYKSRPIFYGLGSFSFHTGHDGKAHGDWIGTMASLDVDKRGVHGASARFVRHNDRNETVFAPLAAEMTSFNDLRERSKALGATLRPSGDGFQVELGAMASDKTTAEVSERSA